MAALALIAVIAAGCGGGSSSSTGSGSGSGSTQPQTSNSAASQSTSSGGRYNYGDNASAATTGGAAVVGTRRLPVGTALVGPDGRTLYLFEKDKGPASTCSGACAKGWPPLTAGAMPKAQAGVKASMLTVIKRPDGSKQVAYNNHPLYYFVGDHRPGQDTGQGLNAFGAGWYVVAPSGAKIDER
jgi:predicted lipoprotein with Yx(FWY)xxD motif